MNELAKIAWQIGITLVADARWAEAADCFRKALELEPECAEIWGDLASAEHQQGHVAAAGAAYERSLALKPRLLNSLTNYGFLLSQTGQSERVVSLLAPMLGDEAEWATAWRVLGFACWSLNDVARAEAALRRAVALAPGDVEARQSLASVLRTAWKLTEAEAICREVLAAHPEQAETWATLGGVLLALGDSAAAVESYRRGLSLRYEAAWHSNLLLALQYVPGIEPDLLKQAHEEWDAVRTRNISAALSSEVDRGFSARGASGPRGGIPSKRQLRVGLVSAQFGRHPTAFLVLPALEALDRERCSVVCYSDRAVEDEYTVRFKAASSIWRPTTRLSAEELAAQIREDEIDVLIDLLGHTGQRLSVFARRAAPLQVTWLGYMGTTGMAAMDGIIADLVHVRPGEERHYTERVLRMPNGYACFAPPTDAPDVGLLPALAAGQVTFGCFNNPAKLNAQLFDAWATILGNVPGSRLLFKFFGLEDRALSERLWMRFMRRGVERERILIEGQSGHRDFLEAYSRVDLALDTQPYSGGLTTCEALWMGVPVVTFPGRTFAGRHAASHLTNAGLTHFVAKDLAGYANCAVSWSRQPAVLAELRSRLRQQMQASPLCDAPRFAHDLLELLRSALQERVG